jgi:hypothetical protein
VAFATTAPEGSSTVPLIDPELPPDCALGVAAPNATVLNITVLNMTARATIAAAIWFLQNESMIPPMKMVQRVRSQNEE